MTWPGRPNRAAGRRIRAEDEDSIGDQIEQMHTLTVIGGSLTKIRTSDSATRASTTTFASDGVLTFSSVPAGTYLFEVHIRWTAGGTNPDIKIAYSMPSGGEVRGATFRAQGTGASAGAGSVDTGSNNIAIGSGGSLGGRGSISGALHGDSSGCMVLTTAGTVALQWAPNSSDAQTLKLDAGSWMRLTRIS